MLTKHLILGIFVIFPMLTHGQFIYRGSQLKVQDQNGNIPALPWTGGLIAAQSNMIDLNGDNVADLVITGQRSLSFQNHVRRKVRHQKSSYTLAL